jgi:hypothetical protein
MPYIVSMYPIRLQAMFRRAVSTIEGSALTFLLRELKGSIFDSVKADSLFSYQPPVNLFALWILLPASYVLTPRWFHKVGPSIYVRQKFNEHAHVRSMCS